MIAYNLFKAIVNAVLVITIQCLMFLAAKTACGLLGHKHEYRIPELAPIAVSSFILFLVFGFALFWRPTDEE